MYITYDKYNHMYITGTEEGITKAQESRARTFALRYGLKAVKLRRRKDGCLNYGGFQVIDPANGNAIIAGTYYELSAVEVMDACVAHEKAKKQLQKPPDKEN